MTHAAGAFHEDMDFERVRLVRRVPPQMVSATLALAIGVLAGVGIFYAHPATTPTVDQDRPIAVAAAPLALPGYTGLLDPALAMGASLSLAQNAPIAPYFEPTSAAPAEEASVPLPEAKAVSMAEVAPAPLPPIPQIIESVPLPEPRPPEVRMPAGAGAFHTPARIFAQHGRSTTVSANPPDNRGFFEKLFGIVQPSGPALAYATPEDGPFGNSRRLTPGPMFSSDRGTAVYDIAAHTVTLPNGTRLEAHSGLGELLDDPRHVSQRMRGATPPAVYDLQLREQLFHGVQALRLNPVGGGTVYGRTGLLAHTFMLGPNGDSNGCVSFRDYNAFLRAYMNGEVRRLVVVAGRT